MGNLIKDTLNAEPKVFYQKMKADYYRYLAEFAVEEIKKEHSSNARISYGEATAAASALAPTHPIRLGLALNYSVFMYEVQGQQQEACTLAKQAFDDATTSHCGPPMITPTTVDGNSQSLALSVYT